MHASFTASTIPLLLFAVYLWLRAKGRWLPVAMFLSIFQAASVFNLRLGALDIGVQPTYLVLLLALAAHLKKKPKRERWAPADSTSVLLGLFVAYATLTAFISPFLFAGVPVSNLRFGLGIPLHWETAHLNQLFYLLLSFAIYWVGAYRSTPAELSQSLRWFAGGVTFASLVGVYQFLCMKTGLPFPSEILHTSPTYAIFRAYEIDGFPRMNSTFTEAAAAAFSMTAGLALSLWRYLDKPQSFRRLVQVVTIGIGLMLTVSTTGYVCLLFLVLAGTSRFFMRWKGQGDARSARTFLVAAGFVVAIAVVSIPGVRDVVVRLSHTVLLDKTHTDSWEMREQWNQDAFRTAGDTYGLGAGWGVCRGSSFIPTLFANAGAPGAALFFAFCAQLLAPLARLTRLPIPLHGAVLVALCAVLLDLIVSAPELSHPIIWLLFAIAGKLGTGRALELFEALPNCRPLRKVAAFA